MQKISLPSLCISLLIENSRPSTHKRRLFSRFALGMIGMQYFTGITASFRQTKRRSMHYRNGGMETCLAESHAAAIKHTVIRVEKTMGVVKAYLQLKAGTATKQMASAHAMLRTRAKVSAGSLPSSHANTAATKRNTEKKSPNALKKSQ